MQTIVVSHLQYFDHHLYIQCIMYVFLTHALVLILFLNK